MEDCLIDNNMTCNNQRSYSL